jgi:hypothetical protein
MDLLLLNVFNISMDPGQLRVKHFLNAFSYNGSPAASRSKVQAFIEWPGNTVGRGQIIMTFESRTIG